MASNIKQTEPFLIEKIIAALSYITLGTVGFLWLLVGIFTKSTLRPFLKYHIFQSIFISIAYFLLCKFLELLMSVLGMIPILNSILMQITYYLSAPFFFNFSAIDIFVNGVIIYLVVTTAQGKYSYLPWVSEIIKENIQGT